MHTHTHAHTGNHTHTHTGNHTHTLRACPRTQVKILEEAGQLPLAYVAAATHGLQAEAERIGASLGGNLPELPARSQLLLPPTPILKVSQRLLPWADPGDRNVLKGPWAAALGLRQAGICKRVPGPLPLALCLVWFKLPAGGRGGVSTEGPAGFLFSETALESGSSWDDGGWRGEQREAHHTHLGRWWRGSCECACLCACMRVCMLHAQGAFRSCDCCALPPPECFQLPLIRSRLVYACIHVCTHAHIHIQAHTHTHTHTC